MPAHAGSESRGRFARLNRAGGEGVVAGDAPVVGWVRHVDARPVSDCWAMSAYRRSQSVWAADPQSKVERS